MHSPFVYDFIVHVLKNNRRVPQPEIENLRRQLLRDNTILQVDDFGAGSRVAGEKTIRQIACTAVKPKKWSQLLYRLVRHYRPHTIIELGTSLGITTAYLAAANPEAHIITIEGSPAIQQRAQQHFEHLHMGFIKSVQGNFDAMLPQVLASTGTVGLAYIDGNHRRLPTLNYFEQLVEKRAETSIFIFDDIHWSAEMEAAWRAIQQHGAVRYTIDLFFLGLVFFRPEFKVKQHFQIRY